MSVLYVRNQDTGAFEQIPSLKGEAGGPVLLWRNESAGEAFAAQSVALDLTEYAAVVVLFRRDVLDERLLPPLMIPVGCAAEMGWYTAKAASRRNVTADASGVAWADNCYWADAGDEAFVTDNARCIPTHIYGFKGTQA